MTSPREAALAPLSRVDAERLLPELSTGRQTLERRVLRARCLKYLESFDLAWAELNAVLPLVKDPLLEARVAVDLLHLSYYLVRREDSVRFAAMAETSAAGDFGMRAVSFAIVSELARSIEPAAATALVLK